MSSYKVISRQFRPVAKLARVAGLGAALVVLALAGIVVHRAAAQQLPPPPPPATPAPKGQSGLVVHVEMVILHAAVLDRHNAFVPGLPPTAFHVFEDKVEQKLEVAKQEDVPVTMGLVVDSSGSMFEKRAKVNAAALTFVKTSNPNDEVFVVNFNDDYYLDTEKDFTSDIGEMKEALDRFDPRGSTALYDAIIGSLDHLKKGHRDKRVLLVITDGMDNASKNTEASTITELEHSDAIVYTVGLFGKDDKGSEVRKARKVLQDLADATGGLSYFPESLEEVEPVCTQIAHDIRNQYTLAYYPSNAAQDGTFRTLRVAVDAPDKGKLAVRTRVGYYAKTAADQQKSGASPTH
jgi:Ca-activated chloride channel homolog